MIDQIFIQNFNLTIRPLSKDDLPAILAVYQQCEDFLALGPLPSASQEMVSKDIEFSEAEGGIYSGIFTQDGRMIGVIDYVPDNYQGNPSTTFLELLMIAAPYRRQGIGEVVVAAIEQQIRKDGQVKTILSGVQVNNPQAIRFWQRNGYRIISGPELMPGQTITYALRKDFEAQG